MAHKGGWKNIKNLLANSEYDGDRLITPIFAHWSLEPVKARKETSSFVESYEHEYSYLVTLIKKERKYQVNLYLYIIHFNHETPLIYEIKHFKKHDYKNLIEFVSTPNRLFSLRKKNKEVRIYKNSRMKEEDFEKEIELCREKQT